MMTDQETTNSSGFRRSIWFNVVVAVLAIAAIVSNLFSQKIERALSRKGESPTVVDSEASNHESEGVRLFFARKYLQSLVETREAVRLDPRLRLAHEYAGKALLQLGDPESAETEFRAAISLRPEEAEYYFDLARALCGQQDRVAEATIAAREAVRRGPGDSTLYGQQYRDYLKKVLASVGSC
jgi:tetratricopeptide (TPR) repeat protein